MNERWRGWKGWIGVDFDRTLAVYTHFEGPHILGAPIPAMVERVKRWLDAGEDVRIFTARVTPRGHATTQLDPDHDHEVARAHIEQWCLKHIGRVLPVTNQKDFACKAIYDDIAYAVVPNTGVVVNVE